MTDAWAQYQSVAAEPIPVRLLWVVRQLQQMSRLVSTVHARAERSPSVAVWHDNFHLLTSSLFRYELEAAGAAAGRPGRRSDDRRVHHRRTAHAPLERGSATRHLRHPRRAVDYNAPDLMPRECGVVGAISPKRVTQLHIRRGERALSDPAATLTPCCSTSSYPLECGGCGAPGTRWCQTCGRALAVHNDEPMVITPRLDPGVPVFSLGRYAGSRRAAIIAMKEHGRTDLVAPFATAVTAGLTRLLTWGVVEAPLALVSRAKQTVGGPTAGW